MAQPWNMRVIDMADQPNSDFTGPRLTVSEVVEAFPHLEGHKQSIHQAGHRGDLHRSKRGGERYWHYHVDPAFERWQAKYLPRGRRHVANGEAGEDAAGDILQAIEVLPASMRDDDPAGRRLRSIIIDRAAQIVLERAGLLGEDEP